MKDQERTLTGYWQTASKTVTGVARYFRAEYDFSWSEARKLAIMLLDRRTRCGICGVPLYWLRLMRFWPFGEERCNRRLTVDHIDPNGPSTLTNARPLCYSCNSYRGHAEQTDEEVLRWMRDWYQRYFTPRHLWWMNISPGQGGQLYRNKYTERRDRRLNAKSA